MNIRQQTLLHQYDKDYVIMKNICLFYYRIFMHKQTFFVSKLKRHKILLSIKSHKIFSTSIDNEFSWEKVNFHEQNNIAKDNLSVRVS